MDPEGFEAFLQAQRAYREIAESLHANSIAPFMAALEFNNRWMADYQFSIAKINELSANSAIQKAIGQLQQASSTSAITQMLRSLDQSPIRDFLKDFNANVRAFQPDIVSKFAEFGQGSDAWRQLTETLRSMDRSVIAGALDAIVRDSQSSTLADLGAMVEGGELAAVAENFDAVLDAIEQSPDQGKREPISLTTQQEIWLGMLMLTLIWLLTLREPENAAARELHNMATGVIVSVLAWRLVRGE